MDIKNYLIPANVGTIPARLRHSGGHESFLPMYEPYQWGNYVKQFTETGFPDLEGVKVAIFGVASDPLKENNAADSVREYFYKLSVIQHSTFNIQHSIADIGNLIPGQTPKDTSLAVEHICSELLENKIIPFIIGESQALTFSNYLAYQKLQQTINLVCVNSKFSIPFSPQEGLGASQFLSDIIKHPSGLLFNLSLVGYQSYFVNNEEIELLKKMYFDVYRLGYIQSKIEEVEPIVRNADILSFNISSIRQSDAPGCANATPNGLYGEEACQIMRYAGMSDKVSSVGIYELNPEFDNRGQTAHLAAQMLWYFLEGVSNRKNDFPFLANSQQLMADSYVKYRVAITPQPPIGGEGGEHEIVFYKSLKTDRWWMEVPFNPSFKAGVFERHHLVPCSYNDYLLACSEEMPDRWWQAYQKLN